MAAPVETRSGSVPRGMYDVLREIAERIRNQHDVESRILVASERDKIPLEYYLRQLGIQDDLIVFHYNLDIVRDILSSHDNGMWLITSIYETPPEFFESLETYHFELAVFHPIELRRAQ